MFWPRVDYHKRLVLRISGHRRLAGHQLDACRRNGLCRFFIWKTYIQLLFHMSCLPLNCQSGRNLVNEQGWKDVNHPHFAHIRHIKVGKLYQFSDV